MDGSCVLPWGAQRPRGLRPWSFHNGSFRALDQGLRVISRAASLNRPPRSGVAPHREPERAVVRARPEGEHGRGPVGLVVEVRRGAPPLARRHAEGRQPVGPVVEELHPPAGVAGVLPQAGVAARAVPQGPPREPCPASRGSSSRRRAARRSGSGRPAGRRARPARAPDRLAAGAASPPRSPEGRTPSRPGGRWHCCVDGSCPQAGAGGRFAQSQDPGCCQSRHGGAPPMNAAISLRPEQRGRRAVRRRPRAQPVQRAAARARRPASRCRRAAWRAPGAAPSASTCPNARPQPGGDRRGAAHRARVDDVHRRQPRDPREVGQRLGGDQVARHRAPTNASTSTASADPSGPPGEHRPPVPHAHPQAGRAPQPEMLARELDDLRVELDHLLAVLRALGRQRPRQRAAGAADVDHAARAGRLARGRASGAGSRTPGAAHPRGRHKRRPSPAAAAAARTAARGRAGPSSSPRGGDQLGRGAPPAHRLSRRARPTRRRAAPRPPRPTPCPARDAHSRTEWYSWPPVNRFGVGSPRALRIEPSVPPRIGTRLGSKPSRRSASSAAADTSGCASR